MKRLFGTDGMRGEAGQFPLDRPTIQTLGCGLVVHLRERLGRDPLIVVGRDTRESGIWLERAFIEGAVAAGGDCKSAGVITTPGIAYLARSLPADAGVVVSASHNPYSDNGIKIFAPTGRKLDDETERLIEADIYKAASSDSSEGARPYPAIAGDDGVDLRARYLDFLAHVVDLNLSPNGLKIVLDCANGAASTIAPALFDRIGAKVISINNKPDGRNINRDCGSLHTQALQQRVLTEKADLGVAFDGDADRSLFVDARGQFVDGDATLWVLAKYLQRRDELAHGLVVATVMSNLGLEIALRSLGVRLIRTDVGDKYVLDELLDSGASLGGEQSGHIIFPRLSLAGDGLITTLCLVRALTEEGKKLHELIHGFARYPQLLVNVRVREKRPFSEIESIAKLIRQTESKLGDQGRLLLRYSGTEPLARVMIEGKNQETIAEYADQLAGEIQKMLGVS
jgi:phosphoglucosamine mutase